MTENTIIQSDTPADNSLNIIVATVFRTGFLYGTDDYWKRFRLLYNPHYHVDGPVFKLTGGGAQVFNALRSNLKEYPTLGDFQKINSMDLCAKDHYKIQQDAADRIQELVTYMGGTFANQDWPAVLESQAQRRQKLFENCPDKLFLPPVTPIRPLCRRPL